MPEDIAQARKIKPYLFAGQTTSLCETCLRPVPAKILIEEQIEDQAADGGAVYYLKRCPDHGVQKRLVSSDAAYFLACRDYLKPGDVPLAFHSRTEHGCPFDCGLCPDHEQHSCLAIVEINDVCNLSCPVCFADSSPQRLTHRPLAEVEAMLDLLVASEGEPDVVQISGGEPTLHPDILAILAAAKRRPIRHLMLNTNGIRIAQDPAFVAALKAFTPGFEVYLQFDSLEAEALKAIRGADLRRIRAQALANLEAAGIATTLVAVVARGVNDHECAAIVDHALGFSCVRGVTFQPVQMAGRTDGVDPDRHRVLLTDIRRAVGLGGVFGREDILPLPCNPTGIAIAYGLREGRTVTPVTSLVPKEVLTAAAPNSIAFEKDRALKKQLFDVLSLGQGEASCGSALSGLLCCLPSVQAPDDLTYANVFRVTIIEFLDRYNFCTGNVKRSCIHFVTPDDGIIPFDTYNLFYRDGAVADLRARYGWRAGAVAPVRDGHAKAVSDKVVMV